MVRCWMIIAYVPLVVCLVGMLLFALSDAKVSTLGKDMFWTGLLVTLVSLSGHLVTLGR